MSRARHRAAGGAVERAAGGAVAYAGGESNVMKEAHERKRGGKVKAHVVDGEMAKPRHGRPGRKRGGAVGADKTPLSSAAKISQKSFEEKEGSNHSN